MPVDAIATPCPCTCAISDAHLLPVVITVAGAYQYTFTASPGLYQFSVIADARDFNWDELYIVLNEFDNVNQRTGPWDFNLQDGNRALVPTYRVTIDAQPIGLWFFQRVSIEDIAAKRFRGRMAFHLVEGGTHTLTLQPYRPMTLTWTLATLEPDPEDTLEPLTADLTDWSTRVPAASIDWAALRAALQTTHACYAEPLRRAFAWVDSRTAIPNDLPLLIARYRLEGNPDALATALQVIDTAIALPHWGNPREEGYSHDGDMGAAFTMRELAYAWHALNEELGIEHRTRLLEKLRLQGERFVALALLNRDYWGGSVMQDHGWKSLFGFADAALHLLGVLPEATRWATYLIPRVRRSVDAMPRDGIIPLSNYCQLYLYLDDVVRYRDTLRALTGEDIFDQPHFRAILDYLLRITRPQDHLMLLEDTFPLIGGNGFLNRMATKFDDARAATLQQAILTTHAGTFYHPTQANGYFAGALAGLLTFEPTVPALPEWPTFEPLAYFPDGGLATYRDPLDDVTLTVRCAPFAGYHAYRHARGPCDRMSMSPGAGHFTLALGAAMRLVTPDGGYKLQSALRTCLLVDGAGQYGDIGYPMSIPAKRDRGEEIVFARWDAETQTGWIRLDLAPAYPDELGLASYTRDLLLYPGEKIICRDTVAASHPHRWSWLFHGTRANGITLDGLTCVIGEAPALRITPRPLDIALTAGIAQTPVVWSYASSAGFKPFDHARYDSVNSSNVAQVDFLLTWK